MKLWKDGINTKFICPKCKSNYFGSSGEPEKGTLTRYCHGYGCSFTFNEKDDFRYFWIQVNSQQDYDSIVFFGEAK